MKETAKERRFWLYRLGPGTATWGEVAHDLVLGWWSLGDLRDYEDRTALSRAALARPAGAVRPFGSAAEQAAACWDFAHVMDVGDIVVAVKGARLLGLGIVTGGYRYEVDRAAAL